MNPSAPRTSLTFGHRVSGLVQTVFVGLLAATGCFLASWVLARG